MELEVHPVNVQVKGFAMESPATDINNLLVVKTLKFDHASPAVLNNLCEKYSHLNDFTFPSFSNNQNTMLIGIDNFDLIVPTKVLTGPPNTPKTVECKLGWSITAPNNINTICTSSTTLQFSVQSEDDKLSDLVSSWWRLESLGRKTLHCQIIMSLLSVTSSKLKKDLKKTKNYSNFTQTQFPTTLNEVSYAKLITLIYLKRVGCYQNFQ